MLVCRAGIHQMLVRMVNREDPDQTASSEAIWSGPAQFVTDQDNDILTFLQLYHKWQYYTIIDLCSGGHEVLLKSKRHIDLRRAEVNMI